MKFRNGYFVILLIFALVVFTYCVIHADDGKTKPVAAPIAITDEASKQALRDAYNAVVSANQQFTIAMLNAKVKYGVSETWRIDLPSMTFVPPPPPTETTPAVVSEKPGAPLSKP